MKHSQTGVLRGVSKRNGSTYLMVVAISVIVSAVSIGALSIEASIRKKSQIQHEMADAGALARSAVEYALMQINDDEQWRDALKTTQNGTYTSAVPLGNGKIAWQVVDPVDGLVENNRADVVKVYGKAETRLSKRALSLTAVPAGRPLDVLRTAIHATGGISIANEVSVGLGPISTDSAIEASDATLLGDAEANELKGTLEVDGSLLLSGLSKQMPSRELFGIYSTMSNEIDFANLATAGQIKDTIVNNSHNPSGSTNAQAIYRIVVPANSTLTIENAKLDATLLVDLSGDGAKLNVASGVVWNPHAAKLPALIVYTEHDASTTVSINCTGTYTAIVQATAEAADGAGVGAGEVVDAGQGALVPASPQTAEINGLVHVIRNGASQTSVTNLTATNRFTGCIVVEGEMAIHGHSEFVAMPDLLSYPPLGYTQARDASEMLSNSEMNNGLEMWQPTLSNEASGGADLDWIFSGVDNAIKVTNRMSAASGIQQDVTSWLTSGETYTLTGLAKLADVDGAISMVLECETDTGLVKNVVNQAVTTSETTLSATFTPVFSGTLIRARLLLCTREFSQDFYVYSAKIADTRTIKPGELLVFPTTWQIEPVQ